MTWAVGMSDKAAEWMQRLARGVLPVSMPGQLDRSLGKLGKRRVAERLVIRIDPVTEEGFTLHSYFAVARGGKARLVGQSIARHYFPELTAREFMPRVDASVRDRRLFERIRAFVLANDHVVDEEICRTAAGSAA